MKKIILLIVFLVSIGVLGCSRYNSTSKPHAILLKDYSSIEELAKDTPLVITGKVAGNSEKFDYKHVTFIKTKISIENIYRSGYGLKEGDNITLLQTEMEEDPVVDKSDKLLLFLRKYEGPVIDDAYMIIGLEKGHFFLKDNKIYSKAAEQSFISLTEKDKKNIVTSGLTVQELNDELEKVKYTPNIRPKVTDEEREKWRQQAKDMTEMTNEQRQEFTEQIRKTHETEKLDPK
ncbi:MAG: hypothetical protein JL50_20420 [Peptococcaceae bacterium BICA1-7]|nr:MAG: hypothetical protein JL50_20420 [Peptococcaceae bacterium BICA1-7]HBV98444.1 hypothetical protein [Desulfotomaculum sp.]